MPKYAHIAPLAEIAANDYSLNMPLYVDTFEEEAVVDVAGVQAEILKIEEQLDATRAELAKALRELTVS